MLKHILLSLVVFFSLSVLAIEEVDFAYSYDKNHGVDFSTFRNGPFKVSTFTDSRDVDDPKLIAALNSEAGYRSNTDLADLVKDAIVQGFLKGDAGLVDEGETMSLAGQVVSTEAEVAADGAIQLTVRASVQLLQPSGRTVWQSNLFGRGNATADEGIAGALSQALTRIVDQLMLDDYFLMEIL